MKSPSKTSPPRINLTVAVAKVVVSILIKTIAWWTIFPPTLRLKMLRAETEMLRTDRRTSWSLWGGIGKVVSQAYQADNLSGIKANQANWQIRQFRLSGQLKTWIQGRAGKSRPRPINRGWANDENHRQLWQLRQYWYIIVTVFTYQQAASNHHVAEVLAGHQWEGALLLELPEHVNDLKVNDFYQNQPEYDCDSAVQCGCHKEENGCQQELWESIYNSHKEFHSFIQRVHQHHHYHHHQHNLIYDHQTSWLNPSSGANSSHGLIAITTPPIISTTFDGKCSQTIQKYQIEI